MYINHFACDPRSMIHQHGALPSPPPCHPCAHRAGRRCHGQAKLSQLQRDQQEDIPKLRTCGVAHAKTTVFRWESLALVMAAGGYWPALMGVALVHDGYWWLMIVNSGVNDAEWWLTALTPRFLRFTRSVEVAMSLPKGRCLGHKNKQKYKLPNAVNHETRYWPWIGLLLHFHGSQPLQEWMAKLPLWVDEEYQLEMQNHTHIAKYLKNTMHVFMCNVPHIIKRPW